MSDAKASGVFKIGGDMEARAVPIDRMVETFAALCDEASNAGTKVAMWSTVTITVGTYTAPSTTTSTTLPPSTTSTT